MSNSNLPFQNEDYEFGNISLNLTGLDNMINLPSIELSNYAWNSTLTQSTTQPGAIPSSYNTSTFTWPGANGPAGSIGGLNINSGYTSTSTTTPSLKVNGDIEISDNGDIRIGSKSLKTFMEKIEDRLTILQPNPELLEKFEALKQAYEHYKTLEALCMGDIPKDPNEK